ncbi:NHLP family bacteriocin export ABC transporter permease/ATPase subunit [Streptomyces anthocyanicus]|uniref:NHLP bacteriocin export ABC transporter permease/ATPase subunit n=2 Tax=Streptomyces violaceoruber group TaxID=2867121 RepID=A0ABT4P6Q6_9ACTN|nr:MULTISPECIES: NHLP bacteriocin export ABC transporter permease/ATPase subunit [Streptomyces]MCW8116356.1 NHLP bacteriocin export ABC transporter permease/ATPase subunit [Streptomyces anthocyanicus]MCZ4636808.1 NHLP bacteriocin export ABC transporter permease/ATPase subunit [Streptomyces rubrogriseus]REH19074.1 ATP-binding cassette subfamily C protein [Streptomyces sp. 2221.1]WSB65098.1 NHLP bacteriocin export ABC transporter permease/ATPase subunit [Streptomyces anthocyanicus]WTC06937.1 NHL
MTTVHEGQGDLVLGALGSLGTRVDCAGFNRLDLEGPQVLWLVVSGAVDLFAVDAGEQGHWHHLGRLAAGSVLLGPVAGPQHTLVARPLRDCVVHRIGLRELYQPAPTQTWSYDAYGNPQYVPPTTSPLEYALALGVGRGLTVLFQAPMATERAGAPTDDDVFWMQVPPGSVQYGAVYGEEAAADLLMDPALWQSMVDQQYRLLTTLDRWIEQLERTHETRTAAGIKAGEAVRARADRTLLASIGKRSAQRTTAADADATYAACGLVARAAGIPLAETSPGGTESDRLDPVERIALASRVRTRSVRLADRWWREDVGPLVGHRTLSGAPVALLWRRGGYVAVHPATGRETPVERANAGEFEPRAVMFYRPLPERRPSPLGLLRFCLAGTHRDLTSLLLAGLVTVALGALVPIATGRVLGEFVPKAQTGLIVQVCLAVMLSSVVAAAFMLLQNLTILRLEGRIEATLQPAVWDRLLRLPTKFFTERSTGELASAAMGISAIRRLLAGVGPTVAQSVTVGAMNLGLLLWYSVPMAFAAIGMLVVVAGVFLGLGLWQVRWQRRLVKLTNKLNNQAFQTLRGLPKLRVAAAENYAYAAWAERFAHSRELQQRAGRIKNLNAVLGAVYLPLCTLLMFMLLAGPARGSMSAAEFLTFNASVTMLLTSVTQLTGAFVSGVAALPLFEEIRPVLDATPEVRTASTRPGPLSGAIEARRLSFRYTDDGPLVLDDVSFEVRPGEFVAVVGPSGCGKSTLLRLLIGFDRPLSGSVLYDGQDLAALDQSAVRRQCGVVLQHAQPFTGSILDVICGTEAYTPEEAMAAARMAGLAEDIERMPMGLHTIVSGSGAVSGGQRQRLMIAQALIRRPRILFFDEATSALDNETQRRVIESTKALNATRIVIAHRLSTVLDADRVIVMEDGRVAQQGPPARLLADTGGRLHELVRRQLA